MRMIENGYAFMDISSLKPSDTDFQTKWCSMQPRQHSIDTHPANHIPFPGYRLNSVSNSRSFPSASPDFSQSLSYSVTRSSTLRTSF